MTKVKELVLTEEDKKQEMIDLYLAAKGDRCPYCNDFVGWTDDVAHISMMSDGEETVPGFEDNDFGEAVIVTTVKGANNELRARCYCAACERKWVEVYTLTGIEEIEEK